MAADIEVIAAIGQRMVDVINESIQIAGHSESIETRRSRVRVARENIGRLQELAASYPFIKLERLTEVERDLARFELEIESLAGPPEDRRVRFERLPLENQCRAIGIPLDRLQLERKGKRWLLNGQPYPKPELAALAHYEAQGFVGMACEGSAPLILMKCACLDFLAHVNTFGSRSDACARYFEAQCAIHTDKAAAIVAEVAAANEATIRRNLREIMAEQAYFAPPIPEDAMVALWHAITPAGLSKLAKYLCEDPYGRRAGWPDLTLASGTELLFVEVKTSDRLHASQKALIKDVLLPFGAEVRVLQLRPLTER